MADRRIRQDLDEVRTKGGYHVGYVWREGDAWKGRGRRTSDESNVSHDVQLTKTFKTRKEAAAELVTKLKDAGMFDPES